MEEFDSTQAQQEPIGSVRKEDSQRSIASRQILGMRVDCTHYSEAVNVIVRLSRRGASAHVCVATVHMVMEAHDDEEFRRVVNAAELVTPDGVPLVWCLRLLGLWRALRVYGPTLTPRICSAAQSEGIRVGFYGGTEEVLERMTSRLQADFPDLDIAFRYSPPFRPATPSEDDEIVAAIEDAGVQILFVGLGCPKQERWMSQHRDRVSCVMVGVGAAFDFIAGVKPLAPAWMQRAGLEWLFRLASEPKRLWRRYCYHNPRFLWAFARQLWRHEPSSEEST